MVKRILPCIAAIIFVFQMQVAFGQYSITSTTEIVYSGGVPTVDIVTCAQDSISYRITESTYTGDTIYIKLPDGITYNSLILHSDSNVSVSHIVSPDSVPEFKVTPGLSKFKFTILVNTPPCNALHSSNQATDVWAKKSTDTIFTNHILSITNPELVTQDVSLPHPISLGVGNVDEFVFALTDFTNSTEISKIYFNCSPDPNIQFYSQYYLTTDSARGRSGYYNKYTYHFLPHSLSHTLLPADTIDSLTIHSMFGHSLEKNDTIFVHIPYIVKSCNDTSGKFQFYTVCPLDSSVCNIYTDVTHVGINLGDPELVASVDTFDLGSFCSKIHKDSSDVKFMYVNHGIAFSTPPGNARADSLRIYLSCNTSAGHIEPNSIKINNILISSLYIHTYTDGHFTVNEIDLTHYPANALTGLAFGSNTIQDLDGYGYADAIAEKDTFYVSARYIYDTASCFPFAQCSSGAVYLPFIGAKYNNECYSLETEINPNLDLRIDTNLSDDASYEYYAESDASTITAPPDIIFNSEFPLTICPDYIQTWEPLHFGFDCPHAYYTMTITLPTGYSLDTADHSKLHLDLADANAHHSNLYKYVPLYTDSSACFLRRVDTLHPLLQEFYNLTDTTLVINFGRVDSEACGNSARTLILSCINIPLILACNPAIHAGYVDTVPFTFQYTCDSACSDCSDILTCGSTTTYNHPCGTSNTIPFTKDSALTIFRTNAGYINQHLPKYYSRSCSTLDTALVASIVDTLKDKSDTIINLDAGYPGDQVETTVNGGYDSLTPSKFENEYLQIRHPIYAGSPYNGYLFELDPNLKSYFIIHGCSGVASLNGDTLVLPIDRPGYTDTVSGTTVEMNFSIDSAMRNSYPLLYALFIADTLHEYISVSAHLHLRIWNPHMSSALITGGAHVINLRNDYMAVIRPALGPPPGADSLHSSDSWGTRFNILQPVGDYISFGASSISACDTFDVGFGFGAGGINHTYDDFPNEFRPYYELDSVLTVTLPKGYTYHSTTFYTYMDNYTSNSDSNYFKGGADRTYFTIKPAYRTNIHNNPDSITKLAYIGLNHSCWPLIDQKVPYSGENQGYYIQIKTLPACNAQSPATFYSTAGYRMMTQQPDTNFQYHYKTHLDSAIVNHVNPIVKIGIPPVVTDYSNLISFKFTLCDSGSYAASNGWVAFKNPAPDTLNLNTATLTNLHTHHRYYPNLYDANSGVFFNVGNINTFTCDTLLFSAYIDSNSHSCPPPKDSGVGVELVKYGNTCNDTLTNPDSTACSNNSVHFNYKIYANDLILTNNGFSPDTVSLCGGKLMDSLTITSADLGTISNPEFWVVPPAGDVVDSIEFRYPCDGARDTTIHVPDTTSTYSGGTLSTLGWILNKDLKIHGLRGTYGLRPLSDSNTICVKVYMTMSCSYASGHILYYASGISTCSILDTSSVSSSPIVKSACCNPSCWASETFDTILINPDAKLLARSLHNKVYSCKKILLEGTFTVDTSFYFSGCDILLAPNALINIVDSSWFAVEEGACTYSCSHLHAACDTMWRGIFVHPGSTFYTTDETLIEDADTAIYAINKGAVQGLYNLNVSTFNKNYKNIVITPCTGTYNGGSGSCLYTCRNFDSILTSSPYNCVNPESVPYAHYYGNWRTAHVASLLAPHAGQLSYIGLEIDTVGYYRDTLSNNTFDYLQYGILSTHSNIGIYTDLFWNIINTTPTKAAITVKGMGGTSGNKLFVGGPPSGVFHYPLSNNFVNCTTGVYADSGFKYVDIAHNIMYDSASAPGSYGVRVDVMNVTGDSLFIDQDTITNFNKGISCNMNNFVTANINYNVIKETICSSLNWVGIEMNEASSPHAHYTVDSNTISVLYRGIVATGLYNSNINSNKINIGPFSCVSYLHNGDGIGLQNCDTAHVGCNIITAGFSPNTYAGIIESSSIKLQIINDSITSAHVGIEFTGNPTTGDSLYNNILHTEDTGIYRVSSATLPQIGSTSHATDNTFIGTACRTSTGPLTVYFYSTVGYVPTPGCFPATGHNPYNHGAVTCASVPSRSRSHSLIHHNNDSTYFDSATIAFMENTALSKDTFDVCQDTSMVIEKEGLVQVLWENPYLLNNGILKNFYDSIINAPMGLILIIDTSMLDTVNNASNLLTKLNNITPANNIEANLQIATQAYLELKVNDSLSINELTTLRTLASRCPDWDGNGVYQARALLSLFDSPSTVYTDACELRITHKPNRKKEVIESTFNLYPNPNNGGFTLAYLLLQGQSGTFSIYDMLGKKIATYSLDPNSDKMSIDKTILDNGIYLYTIVVNDNVVKQDKLVIIK